MMACGLSKSLGFSSSLKKQQGIVTILGGSNISSAPSLRRTFSADLSSKNWLSHNEVSPMKRISSSEKLHNFGADSLSSQDEEQGSRSGVDIWAQIQEDKTKKKEDETEPSQTDVWSSILSDKKKKKTDTVVEYVHPLVKRASSLSEKSLEICTESLGSETGCEGFSSYASSDTGEAEDNLVLDVTVTKEEEEETEVVVVVEVEQEARTVPDQTRCMELPRGSFPPPIRSLSSQTGSALHMKTRRDNGRLVLEAVSMPSHNNFSAKRQDGRLLLTFAEIDKDDDAEEVQWSDKEEEEEEEEEQEEFAYKPFYKLAQKPIEPITVHRLAHKPIGVPRRNTRWPATDESETKSDMSMPVVHSLPPRPRVAQLARSMKPPSTVDDTVGAACFNTCDYSWKPTNNEVLGRNTKAQFQAQNYVQKSMGVVTHDLVNGCKEPRRSLLSVERFCIATS